MRGQNDWRRSEHSGQRRPPGANRGSGTHGRRERGQNGGSRTSWRAGDTGPGEQRYAGARTNRADWSRGGRPEGRAEDDWPGSERGDNPDWSGEQEINRAYEDESQYGGPSMYGQYGGGGYDLDDDQNERQIGGQGYLGGYDLGGNRYGGNSLYAGGATGQRYGGRTAMRGGHGYMAGYGVRPQGNFGTLGQSWRPDQGPYRGHTSGGRRFAKGPKGYQRSDERIREDLCDRLMGMGELDSSDVEVNVKDGEVSLTGTVPDRDTKHHIERLADTIAGVTDINNQLKVKREGAPANEGGTGNRARVSTRDSSAK